MERKGKISRPEQETKLADLRCLTKLFGDVGHEQELPRLTAGLIESNYLCVELPAPKDTFASQYFADPKESPEQDCIFYWRWCLNPYLRQPDGEDDYKGPSREKFKAKPQIRRNLFPLQPILDGHVQEIEVITVNVVEDRVWGDPEDYENSGLCLVDWKTNLRVYSCSGTNYFVPDSFKLLSSLAGVKKQEVWQENYKLGFSLNLWEGPVGTWPVGSFNNLAYFSLVARLTPLVSLEFLLEKIKNKGL